MAFDPDAYLKSSSDSFDPDAYLGARPKKEPRKALSRVKEAGAAALEMFRKTMLPGVPEESVEPSSVPESALRAALPMPGEPGAVSLGLSPEQAITGIKQAEQAALPTERIRKAAGRGLVAGLAGMGRAMEPTVPKASPEQLAAAEDIAVEASRIIPMTPTEVIEFGTFGSMVEGATRAGIFGAARVAPIKTLKGLTQSAGKWLEPADKNLFDLQYQEALSKAEDIARVKMPDATPEAIKKSAEDFLDTYAKVKIDRIMGFRGGPASSPLPGEIVPGRAAETVAEAAPGPVPAIVSPEAFQASVMEFKVKQAVGLRPIDPLTPEVLAKSWESGKLPEDLAVEIGYPPAIEARRQQEAEEAAKLAAKAEKAEQQLPQPEPRRPSDPLPHEVKPEEFVDNVQAKQPIEESPATREIMGVHNAAVETAAMRGMPTEKVIPESDFLDPDIEADMSFDIAKFEAEAVAAVPESEQISGTHPAAMTPEEFKKAFPGVSEDVHQSMVRAELKAGSKVPESVLNKYKGLQDEVYLEMEAENAAKMVPETSILYEIRKLGGIQKESLDKYYKGELGAAVKGLNLVRAKGKGGMNLDDLANSLTETGHLAERDINLLIDRITDATFEKEFGKGKVAVFEQGPAPKSVNFVRQDIKSQLQSVGQSETEAAANAELVARYVDAESKRRGITPEQFYNEKRRIVVERGEPVSKELKQEDYQGGHMAPAPDFGAPLHDLTGKGNIYPEDVYSDKAAQYYGDGNGLDNETMALAQSFKGKPDARVKIYRAVPDDINTSDKIAKIEKAKAYILKHGKVPPGVSTNLNSSEYYGKISDELDELKSLPAKEEKPIAINPGDWVTINRAYAKGHGESVLNGNYKIISKVVKAKEIFTNGDSIHEWGYWPEGSFKPEQPVLKTDTPEFKAWFGDSKVIDAQGKPLVVYHGTPDARGLNKNSVFQTTSEKFMDVLTEEGKKSAIAERAYFFTDNISTAKSYSKDKPAFDYQGSEPGIFEVYLSIKNPKTIDARGSGWGKRGGYKAQAEQIAEAKAEGHDGLIIRNTRDTYTDTKAAPLSDIYVAFSPEQIKSVNNRGTFDPKDPNILMQGPRASIDVAVHKITLGKYADKSSVVHELAHDFLQDIVDYVNSGKASKEYLDFWEPARAWLKLEQGKGISREQHENFARGFEFWLRTGNAPNTALDSVFRTFERWLKQVYQKATDLNVTLPAPVQGFFSDMLAADRNKTNQALVQEAKASGVEPGPTVFQQEPAPEHIPQYLPPPVFAEVIRRRSIVPGKELTLRKTLVNHALKDGRIARGQTLKVVSVDMANQRFLMERNGEYTVATGDMFNETYEKPLPEPKPLGVKEQIARATGMKDVEPKVALSEKDLLKDKFRNQAKGAKYGLREGARRKKAEMLEKMQDAQADISAIRREITDYITENIPAKDRGKFITIVRDAKSMMDLARAVNRVDIEAASIYRRGVLDDIKKVIGRSLESPGVEVAYKERIRGLLEGLELKGHRASTIAKLQETKKWVAEQRRSGTYQAVPGYIIDEVLILARKPVNEIPDEALEELLAKLKTYEDLGRVKQASKQNVWAIRKQNHLDELMAGKGVGINHNFSLEALKRKGAFEFAIEAMSSVMPMDVVMDIIDGNMKYTGPHYRIKKILDGHYASYLTFFDEHFSPVAKLAKSKGLKEDNFNRIGIYAAARQEGGAERVIQGRPDLKLEDVINLKLTPDEMEVYQAMRSTMDGTHAQVAEVNRILYNRELGKVDEYFSFQTDYDLLNELEMDRRINMSPEEWIKYSKSVKQGFTKGRIKQGRGPIKVNALDIFREHMREVAYFVNMQESIKMFYEVFNTPEYRERYGVETTRHMLSWMNLIARAGRPAQNDVMPWLDTLRVNLGRAMLGFKATSFMIQVGSIMDATALIGASNTRLAMSQIISSRDTRKWLMDNFPELKARVGDDIAFLELGGKTAIAKWGEAGMWPLKAMDEISASVSVLGACFKKMNGAQLDITKPAEPEMVDYATRMMRRTQSSSFAKDLGIAFSVGGGRGGYLTGNVSANKTVLQFRSFLLNRFSMIAHDIPQLESAGDKAWAYVWVMAAILAETGIRWGVRSVTLAMLGAAGLAVGKEMTEDDFLDYMQKNAWKNALDTIPFVSDIGRVFSWGDSPIPVMDALNTAIAAPKEVMRARGQAQVLRAINTGISAMCSLAGVAGTSQAFQIINMAIGKKQLIFPLNDELNKNQDVPMSEWTPDERMRWQALSAAKERFKALNLQYKNALDRGDTEAALRVVERAKLEIKAVKYSSSAQEYQAERRYLGLN